MGLLFYNKGSQSKKLWFYVVTVIIPFKIRFAILGT